MKKIAASTVIAVVLIFAFAFSANGDVTPLRILKEHKITVVTNGETNRLSRSFLNWNFAPVKIISLTQLITERDNLRTDGDVLFIIDRSKPISEAEANLLPIPLTAVDESEVLTAVVKKSIGNKRSYRNGWLILVMAPNQTWLEKELDLIPKVLNTKISEQVGVPSKLHFYNVVMLDIVSTGEEELPAKWVANQLDPNKQAVDQSFCSIDSWEGSCGEGRCLMFVLDRQKSKAFKEKISPAVPKNIRDWLSSDATISEGIAAKGDVEIGGKKVKTYAVIAPCERLVSKMLAKHKDIDSIPSTAAKTPFSDLSDYGQMAVVVRFSDSSLKGTGVLHDFSNKMLAALSSAATGFESKSYQDLKELQVDKLFGDDQGISKDNLGKIKKKLSNSRGLLVLSLASVGQQTTYATTDPKLITEPYPAFSTAKPTEPHEPSLDDRKYGFLGPKIYTGPNDPNFIRDTNKYRAAKRQYEDDMNKWQREYDEYENKRNRHEMEWTVQVDQIEQVEVSGNVAIYDTRQESDKSGTVVFSSPVKGLAEKREVYKELRLRVSGENKRPNIPEMPDAKNEVSDNTMLSAAFENASNVAVSRIVDTSILPMDKLDK